MDMCVGPACTVKDTNRPARNDGTVPPKSVKEFNDALNRSADSKDASRTQDSKDNQSSQHAQDASNAQHETQVDGALNELGQERAQKLRAMPKVYAAPQVAQLANPPPPVGNPPQTITNIAAAIRSGPPNFQMTGQNIPVGTRVDIIDTKSIKGETFVNVVEHGTGKAIGWTAESNLGDYARSGA